MYVLYSIYIYTIEHFHSALYMYICTIYIYDVVCIQPCVCMYVCTCIQYSIYVAYLTCYEYVRMLYTVSLHLVHTCTA